VARRKPDIGQPDCEAEPFAKETGERERCSNRANEVAVQALSGHGMFALAIGRETGSGALGLDNNKEKEGKVKQWALTFVRLSGT